MLENALTSWSQESDIDLPALKALARPANEFKKKPSICIVERAPKIMRQS